MGTGNFYSYDSAYIYVPKVFRALKNIEHEDELEFIYDEANMEVNVFVDKLNDILEPLAKKLEKKYKNVEISVGYENEEYDRVAKSIYGIVITVFSSDKDRSDYLVNYIRILKVPGYYWGFSIDYVVERDEIEPPLLEDLTDMILSKIETLLYKSFDKYYVSARFSSGETWYGRIKDKDEEEEE